MQPKLLFEGRKRGARSSSLIVDEQMRTSLKPGRLSGLAAYELAAVVSFRRMKMLVLTLSRKIKKEDLKRVLDFLANGSNFFPYTANG